MASPSSPSPFLEPGTKTRANTLAIVSLSRDNFQPITLEQSSGAVDGYAEGATLNTRFGSFPHSTLLDIPWGSQVRASLVDTGSRGRKRRRDEVDSDDTPVPSPDDDGTGSTVPAKAVTAASGFIYILRPSPELWTSSLPHRTQVVYTPDYSYILERIRARPGSKLIEAGAGSGSFTHASARAVYSGYPSGVDDESKGRVFSFEFHEPRFRKMQEEIRDHSLEGVVRITHRDVYRQGFLVDDGRSPKATAVFLDLPAPWEALHHLSRRRMRKGGEESDGDDDNDGGWTSPLDAEQSVYICTFSPCIEQVTRTVAELRALGWTDIDMVEIAHKRLNVMRDRVGVNVPGEKGCNTTAADVDEAVAKLKEDLKRTQEFHKAQHSNPVVAPKPEPQDEQTTRSNGATPEDTKPTFMQGSIVHRAEAELKTHTSYLVFAILPREWDADAEAAALAKWPCGQEGRTIGNLDKKTRKEEKRLMLASKKKRVKQEGETAAGGGA
ncbi:hypothetical protein CDD80_5822 [Ophiocordyceps camponoti-rufipedis]|uniref:tRNA (adenine(58)-N(1))-methyltransferase catalytic subunit TRM61 n=1 Tax=Ophiocordyceps camponoti-rufipedis TaxID=2004952 RepID=A0A2C5ZM86_9HYPO|nr:hypothetical protein CDD80_5822 [Ophiocordyceps camponoti-rufipedis]